MIKDIYKDFDIFARALVGSNDQDPVYPFIKDLLKEKPRYDPVWFVFVYVAFYNLSTAIEMCDLFPNVGQFRLHKQEFLNIRARGGLKAFGHERRGSCRNVNNQLLLFAGAEDFILNDLPKLTGKSNKKFREVLMTKSFHGAWAAFKIAEIFEKSLGWNELKIQDLGIDERDPNSNDGPVGGLRWLYGRDNKYTNKFFKTWNNFGFELAKAYDFDIGEIETCLCKFHKTVSGKYFVGHDIQEFVELKSKLNRETYQRIMSKNFHTDFWKGIHHLEKDKKSHYSKTGEILNSHFGEQIESVDVREILLQTS